MLWADAVAVHGPMLSARGGLARAWRGLVGGEVGTGAVRGWLVYLSGGEPHSGPRRTHGTVGSAVGRATGAVASVRVVRRGLVLCVGGGEVGAEGKWGLVCVCGCCLWAGA